MMRANRMLLRGLITAYRTACLYSGIRSDKAQMWRSTIRRYIGGVR